MAETNGTATDTDKPYSDIAMGYAEEALELQTLLKTILRLCLYPDDKRTDETDHEIFLVAEIASERAGKLSESLDGFHLKLIAEVDEPNARKRRCAWPFQPQRSESPATQT